MWKGKFIVVGVTGGIAAYKAAEITSRLRQLGADVQVVMTRSATEFVAPLTFRTLSGNPVLTGMFTEPVVWETPHIALAERADAILIAPATANIIGKIASGIADDLLTAVVMATKAPVLLAPAMNSGMYTNPILQQNLNRLRELGYHVVEPDEGFLACGSTGKGRLPDPEVIIQALRGLFYKKDLAGRTLLVTAGPTQEAIDPVRYITNHASGRMGYAVAEAARDRGARVILVSGPTALSPPAGIEMVSVVSARDMYQAVLDRFADADVVVKAAAVGDYRPAAVHKEKLKKKADPLVLNLERNPDILAELGRRKSRQILVGFAAETTDLLENARNKLMTKNLDLIVANDVTRPGSGFASETNSVTLLDRTGAAEQIPLQAKNEIAHLILDRVAALLAKKEADGQPV